ncbi:hypothetical protein Tco_0457394, partial [Tanacetum coccineum]
MPYDEYALGYLKFSFKNTKRVRFRITIPNTLITEDIRTASYYPKYVAKVAKHQRFLVGEEVSDDDAPPPKPAKGATANPFGLVESSSLYAELGLTDSGTESDEEVSPE